MKIIVALHIGLLMMTMPLFAQVSDTTSIDTAQTETLPGDTLRTSPGDTLSQIQAENSEPEKVIPWKEKKPNEAYTITNDSLMRWQIWPNWGDYQAYRRDAISFRQGTNGRVDAFHINGYEPYEQRLYMEGISLNNPITGLANYNLIPHRKIGMASEQFGGNYYSDIRLRDFYIIKPISYLNYDEAGGAYRNLEFLVSQNFTQQTNLEVSYWDRRGGDYYPNSGIEGSQVVGRVYHHLNDRFLIRGMYLRNQFKNDEPFGYNVADPSTFSFDEFNSVPIISNGRSEFTRWDLAGGIYHRPDTSSTEDAGLETTITNNEKVLRFPGDTLSWDIRSLGGKLFKSFRWNGFEVRGELSGQHHSVGEPSVVSEESWTVAKAAAALSYQISEGLQLYGKGALEQRSDAKNGFDVNAGIRTQFEQGLYIGVDLSNYSRIPTMQAMYWISENYRGNAELENEEGISATGKIGFQLTSTLKFGASGRYKTAENATFLSPDSSFTNSSGFKQTSGMIYGRFDNHRFEIESSGTIQQFTYKDLRTPVALLNKQDQILWLRNSVFVKGYVFDRAAYLKIGVKTLLSPFFYSARTYNTELGYWQGNSSYQELPPFFRLDGELSARVRGIMVVLRWENALDGVGQAGYFEAAGFPMPPRRLIVGIRAQFRN